MIHFPVAIALLVHVLLWGAGMALLVMPGRWWRFWPLFAFPGGLALQSAVVWAGAQAGLRGTNTYALGAEFIPVILLAVGLRRHGLRRAAASVYRLGLVGAAMFGCLMLAVLPVAVASQTLTTISLGSCDAADYAAGARVLMEFARSDREGLLGLTEVVRVQSVDNFFDYWLRLNHFSPSALMAFNGSVLHCAPHEVATLLTAVLVAGLVPAVFWVARAVVGHSGGVSLIIAGLAGVSPVLWYALAHVSPGQLLAAQAVAWLTWAGVALWRTRLTWRRGAALAGGLMPAYWLVLGGYNFFVLVCLVPALAHAAGLACWRRAWGRLLGWSLAMTVPLMAVGGLFRDRVAGLAERFSLLRTYDFGWPVPALTAEGWLGMVQGPDLSPWSFLGLRWGLSAGVVGLLAWVFLREARRRPRGVWTVIALTGPVLAAYVGLEARGATLGTNASYDAYKLFAVFFPVLLPALCWWFTLRYGRGLHDWLVVGLAGLVVIGFNLVGCGMFVWKLCRPPLMVDAQLAQLQRIESMADVASLNLTLAEPDMWSRLWASAFLLRKPHYFATDTYEARWHTPLRGDWDLEGGLITLDLPAGARRPINSRYALLDTRHPLFVRVGMTEGWHPEERTVGSGEAWQWTRGNSVLRVENAHPYGLRLESSLDAWSPIAREVSLRLAEGEPGPWVHLTEKRAVVAFPPLDVPPGVSLLELHSRQAPIHVPGDPRALGFSVFRLRITPRR